MSRVIKALTICQPYASLIADGEKWVENRHVWRYKYRGPLAIHAGSGTQYLNRRELASYTTGAVIAVAELLSVVSLAAARQAVASQFVPGPALRDGIGLDHLRRLVEHEHTEGPLCLLLGSVRAIDPVPCRGYQGLWNWTVPAATRDILTHSRVPTACG